MSAPSASGAPADAGPFRPATVVVLIVLGLAAFIAIVLTYTYRPSDGPLGGGQGHALSNAATGYAGIVRLVQGAGRNGYIVRDEDELGGSGLMVLTPPSGDTPIGDALARRGGRPTLVMLPKWRTMPDADHGGWVDSLGPTEPADPQGVLAPGIRLTVTRSKGAGRLMPVGGMPFAVDIAAPATLQSVAGDRLAPLLTDNDGRIVLAQIGNGPLYVLADPDILANLGMREEASAAGAVAMLTALAGAENAPIGFDVTLAGLGRPPNILRLAFEPPFLAMTLALLVAVLLAAWQALARFGPVARRERAIAFGKSALVDNSAALIAKAGRQARLGGRYAEVIRDRAVTAFGVPARLRDAGIDAYLDKLRGRARFSELVHAAADAGDKASLVVAARALHDWQKENST